MNRPFCSLWYKPHPDCFRMTRVLHTFLYTCLPSDESRSKVTSNPIADNASAQKLGELKLKESLVTTAGIFRSLP
jgi:hypothetical protein